MRHVAIIGLGLMGGSLGLALKRKGGTRVSAWSRRAESRRRALELGAADAVFGTPEEAVAAAGLVVYCTPVLTIPELVRRCRTAWPRGCVVTDVASTKQTLVEELGPLCREAGAAFVGSHPLAGSEQAGIEAARADLYAGAVVAVTPDAETPAAALAAVCDLWSGVGARVVPVAASEHDRIVARTSHLPHMVAALLAATVGRDADPRVKLFCGPGFRDATRIAGGSPELWHDVVKTNREALLRELRAYGRALEDVIRLLEEQDFEGVRRWLEEARNRRAQLQE